MFRIARKKKMMTAARSAQRLTMKTQTSGMTICGSMNPVSQLFFWRCSRNGFPTTETIINAFRIGDVVRKGLQFSRLRIDGLGAKDWPAA